ncbi:MAG TPA: immunoglobulin domain-containing protein, partial [Verrucomicrobiae bacterium]|nr:immunoglobulin domain-containing protein [Verrucomicrobiae bacterium]
TGTAPLFYQWRVNGRSVPGATNANLVLPSAQGGAAGEYSVVLYNAAGFVISTGATLRIEEPLQILAQPQGHVVNRGSTVVFQVFAAGTGPLHYQWRHDDANLAGATNSILTLTGVEPEQSGNYSAVVSDNSGSIASADATLSVLQPPTIVEQPQPQTAVAYTDVFFSVTAGGQGPFTYQWRVNGLAIPGATSSILGLPNVQPEQAGVYTVEVANPVASMISASARLTLLIPVTIVQQPQNINVVPGATAGFTVLAASSSALTYQWRFNDVDIPGATNSTLTITNAQEANSGGYYVMVWDAISSVRSQVANLGIIIPLSFVQLPLSQSVPEGGSVTLSAEVRGSPVPFGFEWRRLATVVASNTSYSPKAFFTLTNLQLSNSSSYRLIVRNAANSVGIASVPIAQITVVPDFDHDGLPDLYEQSIGLNTNNAADAFTDLDHDGVSNYQEYLAGTDPLDPLSYLRVDEEIENSLTTILFPAGSNRTYTVEYTDDLSLGTWNKLDDLVAYPTNHIRRLIDPAASQNRFYRVVTPRRP